MRGSKPLTVFPIVSCHVTLHYKTVHKGVRDIKYFIKQTITYQSLLWTILFLPYYLHATLHCNQLLTFVRPFGYITCLANLL